MSEKTIEERLNALLPVLVKDGRFGPGEYVSFSIDVSGDTTFQFGSIIHRVTLELSSESGGPRKIRTVIKVQVPGEKMRKVRDSATMFHNEITMYNDFLPYLNKEASTAYPKVYYGLATRGEDYDQDVLIMENMNEKGFVICPEQVYLDYDHISLAIKRLAELHAWSYTEKLKDPEKFSSMIGKFGKFNFEDDEEFDFELMNFIAMKKGMEYFLNEGIEKETLEKFLKIAEKSLETSDLLREAEEPLGVVIHGDFCKNNLFYKYDREGRPEDIAYFDLQFARYGSPAVDLAFFLYLHSTGAERAAHWDGWLELYWAEVRRRVPLELALPSFADFMAHFQERAVYGYFPCSFFLPKMLDTVPMRVEDFDNQTKEEKISCFLDVGGEAGVSGVRQIVQHLIDNKYIHKFLEYYERTTASSK